MRKYKINEIGEGITAIALYQPDYISDRITFSHSPYKSLSDEKIALYQPSYLSYRLTFKTVATRAAMAKAGLRPSHSDIFVIGAMFED